MPNALLKKLDELSAPDSLPPTDAEAWGLVSDLLDQREDYAADIYAAFREVTAQAIAGTRPPKELRNWAKIFQESAGLFRNRGRSDLAERLAVLFEMAVGAARAGEVDTQAALFAREHVRLVMACFAAHGTTVRRNRVRQETQLTEASLSKVLKKLEACGFIRREVSGREAVLFLTAAGAEAWRDIQDEYEFDGQDEKSAKSRGSETLGYIYSHIDINPPLH